MEYIIAIPVVAALAWLYALAFSHEREQIKRRAIAHEWLGTHRNKARCESETLFRFLFPPTCKCDTCNSMRAELKR